MESYFNLEGFEHFHYEYALVVDHEVDEKVISLYYVLCRLKSSKDFDEENLTKKY